MDKEYRMYCLVLKQLSPIQKGVQSLHSVVEYANQYFMTDEYHQWATKDKTLIMLDGGTHPEMYNLMYELNNLNIKFSIFREPDLDDLVTCISFLASNDVWDNELYKKCDENELTITRDVNYELYKIISKHRLSY